MANRNSEALRQQLLAGGDTAQRGASLSTIPFTGILLLFLPSPRPSRKHSLVIALRLLDRRSLGGGERFKALFRDGANVPQVSL